MNCSYTCIFILFQKFNIVVWLSRSVNSNHPFSSEYIRIQPLTAVDKIYFRYETTQLNEKKTFVMRCKNENNFIFYFFCFCFDWNKVILVGDKCWKVFSCFGKLQKNFVSCYLKNKNMKLQLTNIKLGLIHISLYFSFYTSTSAKLCAL